MRSEQSQAGPSRIDEAEDEPEEFLTPLEGPEQLPALPEQPSSEPDELDLIGAFNQSIHSTMMVSGIDFVYSDELILDLHGAGLAGEASDVGLSKRLDTRSRSRVFTRRLPRTLRGSDRSRCLEVLVLEPPRVVAGERSAQ